MNTYLAIITTVLVLTQIIRIMQNTISLQKHNKMINAELDRVGIISNEDIKHKKKHIDLLLIV